MAGPGGGPPRRSHTESRKGCETCKKRHIRCDETFPQCRNCTKHKQRCPYQDTGDERAASPKTPQMGWTAEIVADIEQWTTVTGIFPFPMLDIFPTPDSDVLTEMELRLIHHVASINYELTMMDGNCFTLWTHQIPTIIEICATHRPSWTQLMQGTSTVLEAMEPWKHTSQFGDFIRNHSTYPIAPPSPRVDHKPSQPSQEDMDISALVHIAYT